MIRYIEQDAVDCDKWDACIGADPSGHFYAYHWYLDMVAPKWDALVYGDYEWVMPLVYGNKYRIIPYLYRPFGVQQLGVFGAKIISESLVEEFLRAIPKKFLHMDIYLNSHNPVSDRVDVTWRRTYELSLYQSYESIYSAYGSQRIKDLKKADKAGLTIMENDSPDVLVRMFQSTIGPAKTNFSLWHYDRMRQIMYALIYRKMGQVVSVYDAQNALCASAFLVTTPKRSVFLFSAQDDFGRKHGAMTKLIDHFLLYGSMRGGTFDFEGSDLPGLEGFYKSFGSEVKTYPRIFRRFKIF